MANVQAPDLKRKVGVAGAKCAMAVNDGARAIAFVAWLNRQLPRDPAVLYLSSHLYSELSLRASNDLLSTAPASAEAHELNAEALETMGKWKEAAEEYRSVLAKNPNLPGIHFRIARLLLSQPNAPADATEQAKHECEQELKVDPENSGANFVLGELARQREDWPAAIHYFSEATKDDVTFADAYLGLGRSLLGAGKPAQAIPPLETAVKLQGDNPETHFQLATAYFHAGRKADGEREARAQQVALQKAQAASDDLKRRASGGNLPPAAISQ